MTDQRPPKQDAALGAVGQLLAFALAAVAAAVVAPALLAGIALAYALRRARLRFTWALPATVALALPLILAPGHRLPAVVAVAHDVQHGHASLASVVASLWEWWLPSAGIVATALGARLDRRDRLHGGGAERRALGALGPAGLARRTLARRRAITVRDAALIVLGRDARGHPVLVPSLRAHAMIVGGSDTGKTTTAARLIDGEIANGRGCVILDGKGGRHLPYVALALARRYRRPLALWSVLPYGDPDLDSRRWRWNPAGGGNATEIKDRVAHAETQTEPHYAAIAARGLLAAGQALQADNHVLRFDHLAALLERPAKLSERLRGADGDRFAGEIAWLAKLEDSERNGLRGMANRLSVMLNSDGGEWLLPDTEGGLEIDLHAAVTEGWLVVFSLPEGSYPALIPQVCRYALSALGAVASRLEREGNPGRAVVFVDELSAFEGDQLAGGLARARSAGISYIVATQSVSNYHTAGGQKLLDGMLDNSELVVIHRQSAPDAAEQLAGVAGTQEAWEHTHKVLDRSALRWHGDESGERARRLTDQFRAHPNTIKQLAVGQAVLVRKRPAFAVDQITVDPSLAP